MPAPVVLFVYNRPRHTQQTVEALARNQLARDTELWIFSDGPKKPEGRAAVEEVRQYINTLAGTGQFKAVHVVEAERNKGLANSIIEGVTRVMDCCGHAIVLEDDLVTAPDFLVFLNAALEHYRTNPKVGSVTGYSPMIKVPPDYTHSVYLISRNCSLGWGTWQDRWQRVDWQVRDFEAFRKDPQARRRFNLCGSDRYDRLRRQVESDINSWSIRFGFWQFRQGMLTVYPVVSRLRNIGNDGTGVHNAPGATYNDVLPDQPVAFTLTTPEPDLRLMRQVSKAYSGSFLSQQVRALSNHGLRPLVSPLIRLLKRR